MFLKSMYPHYRWVFCLKLDIVVWSCCRLAPWLVWVNPRLNLIPSKWSWVWCLPSSVTENKVQHMRITVRSLSALLIQANCSFSFSWFKLKPSFRNTNYCDDIKPSLYSLHKYFAKYQAVQEVYCFWEALWPKSKLAAYLYMSPGSYGMIFKSEGPATVVKCKVLHMGREEAHLTYRLGNTKSVLVEFTSNLQSNNSQSNSELSQVQL